MVSATVILGLVYLAWVPLFVASTIMLHRRRGMHPIDGRFPTTITLFNIVLSLLYMIQGIDSLGVVPCWLYWWVVSCTVVAAYYLAFIRGGMVLFKFRIQEDLHSHEMIRANNAAYEAQKNATLKRQQSNIRGLTAAAASTASLHHHTHRALATHASQHNSSPPLSLESGILSTESPPISQVTGTPTNAHAHGATGNGNVTGRVSIPMLHIIEVKPANGAPPTTVTSTVTSGVASGVETKLIAPSIAPLPAWTPSWYVKNRRYIRPKAVRVGGLLSVGGMLSACAVISLITPFSADKCPVIVVGSIPTWVFWIWFICFLYCVFFSASVIQIMRSLSRHSQDGFGIRAEFRMMAYGLFVSALGTLATAAFIREAVATALGLRISLLFGTAMMWWAMSVWPLYLSYWLERQQRLRTMELEKASTDLHDMLELTDGYNAFLSFCQREFCGESLQFWSRVKQFRKDIHAVQSHHGRGSGIVARERLSASHTMLAGPLAASGNSGNNGLNSNALISPLSSPHGVMNPSTPMNQVHGSGVTLLPAIKVDVSLPGGYLPVPTTLLLPPLNTSSSPAVSPLPSPLQSPQGGANTGTTPLVSPQPTSTNGVHLLRPGVSSRRTPPLSARMSPHDPNPLNLAAAAGTGSLSNHHHHHGHGHNNRPALTREIVQQWLDEARHIYHQYIAPDAMFQVNISADMRKNILRAIDRIQRHLRNGTSPEASPGMLSPSEGLSPHGETKGLLLPAITSQPTSNLGGTAAVNNIMNGNDKRPSGSQGVAFPVASTPVHTTVVSPSNSPNHVITGDEQQPRTTVVTVTAASPQPHQQPRHRGQPQQKYLHHQSSSSSNGGSAAALALALSQGASTSNTFVAIASTHTASNGTEMMTNPNIIGGEQAGVVNTRASITTMTNGSLPGGSNDGYGTPDSPLSPEQQQQRSPSGILDSGLPLMVGGNNAATPIPTPTPQPQLAAASSSSAATAAALDRVAYTIERKRAVTRTKSSAAVHNAHHTINGSNANIPPTSARGTGGGITARGASSSPTPPKLSPHQRSRSLHNLAGGAAAGNAAGVNATPLLSPSTNGLTVSAVGLASRSHSPMLTISTAAAASTPPAATAAATPGVGVMTNSNAVLAANMMNELDGLLKDIDHLFVAAADVVFDLMRSNSWRRFLLSDVYADLAAERRGWTGGHTHRSHHHGGRSRATSRAGLHGHGGLVAAGGAGGIVAIPNVPVVDNGAVMDDDLVASVVAAAAGHATHSGGGAVSPQVSVLGNGNAPVGAAVGTAASAQPVATMTISGNGNLSANNGGQLTDRRTAPATAAGVASARGHTLASRPSVIVKS